MEGHVPDLREPAKNIRVASVTMKEGMLSFTTESPLTAPTSTPTASMATIAAGNGEGGARQIAVRVRHHRGADDGRHGDDRGDGEVDAAMMRTKVCPMLTPATASCRPEC